MEASDRYRIGRRIGGGGMAEVFEAEALGQHGFARRVALKRLRAEDMDEASVRSFIDEATIASRLHHANIVSVLDFGLTDGRPFIVMELVDGLDLAELQVRLQNLREDLPPEIVLHVGIEVCRALEYAHRASDGGRALGIVHRDVSPENILVGYAGEVKLVDFGIAFAHERLEATRVGVVKGKIEYLAPEQVRMAEVDGRADLYSLGVVLHRLLTKDNPMSNPELRARLAAGENFPISPSLPSDLRAVLERATRSSPRQRFASAAEMGQALHAVLADRTKRDGTTLLTEWLSRFREPTRDKPATANPFEAMFDVELVLAGRSGVVRSFTSVGAAVPDVSPPEPTVISSTSPRAAAEDAATVMVEAKRNPKASASIDPGPTDPLLGIEVHGYRIERLIGQGATARVYRAMHSVLDREVAIKVLSGPNALEERSFERLRREAKALLKAGHPNVVSVIDFGTTSLGQPFLATELLRGRTLRQRIDEEGPLSPEAASEVIHQVCAGLVAAHNAGVVHRDLKPSNVFLVPGRSGEVVKLLDFGVARVTLGEGDMTRLTRPDQLLGTPRYMAPEQIRGAAEVGPSADLYALGGLLYFMLSGRPPFEGNAVEVVHKHLSDPAPRLPERRGLERLTARLLEKEPKDRPASAEAVLEELVRLGFAPPKSAPDPITVASSTITEERSAPRRGARALPKLTGLGEMPLGARVLVGGSLAVAVISLLLLFILGRSLDREPEANANPAAAPNPIGAVPGTEPRVEPGPSPSPEPDPEPVAEASEPSKGPRGSKKTPRGSEDNAALERLKKRLARTLSAHGTSEAKVERDAFTKDAYARLERALRAKDEEAGETALAELDLILSNLEIDEDDLNRRLRKLASDLQAVPKGELGNLEDRYLELRSSLRPRMKNDELRRLAVRLGQLERDVRRAR